jgi:type IV secretion system protein TrbL
MSVCPPGFEWACGGVGAVASGIGGSVLSSIASASQHAQVTILADMLTLWTRIPTPGAAGAPVDFLRADTSWVVGFLAVLGLLIAAGKLAWERRAEPAKMAAAGLLNLVLVSGAGVAVITLGSRAGDAYSSWILGQAVARSGGGSLLAEGENLASLASVPGLPALLLIVLAIFGIIACVIQIILLVARIAMLGLLAGLLPLTAAISGTQEGQAWFRKTSGWLLAFLAYKPVAATIYGYAFVSLNSRSAVDQIDGLAVIILAVAALPALMRFVTPIVTGATGSGGGGGAGAGAAALIATGARSIPMAAAAASGGASAAAAGAGGARLSGPPPGQALTAPAPVTGSGETGDTAPGSGPGGGATGAAAARTGQGTAGTSGASQGQPPAADTGAAGAVQAGTGPGAAGSPGAGGAGAGPRGADPAAGSQPGEDGPSGSG